MARKLLRKPVADLEYLTGNPTSTCEKHAGGTSIPSAAVLRDLLRSSVGDQFLDYIMQDSEAPWWRQHLADRNDGRLLRSVIAERERQLELQLRIPCERA